LEINSSIYIRVREGYQAHATLRQIWKLSG
jgi:hypothetical protein